MPNVAIAGWALLWWNAAAPSRCHASDPPAIADVAKALGERRKAIESLKVQFKGSQTIPKGAISGGLPATALGAQPSGPVVIPSSDTINPIQGTLLHTHKRHKYTVSYRIWDMNLNQFVDQTTTVAVNEGRQTAMTKSSGLDWHTAIIKPFEVSNFVSAEELSPLFLSVWLGDAKLTGCDLANCRWTGRKLVIQGTPCLECQPVEQRQGREKSLWLAPSRGWALLRFTESVDGVVRCQWDYKLKADPILGWVPASWTSLLLTGGGKLQSSMSVTVTEFLVNGNHQEGDYGLELPVGTRVLDLTGGERVDYILRGDGTRRDIPKEDLGASYETLLQTSPGGAFGRQSGLGRWGWAGLLLGGAVVLGGAAIARRALQARAGVPCAPVVESPNDKGEPQ